MTFQPQNNLERKLISAVNDPSSRLDFYRELQNSNIYMIQIKDGEEDLLDGVLEEDTLVKLINIEINNRLYIPFFSSLLRLQEFVDQEASYLSMNSMDFFNLTQGADLLLNPRSSCGKEFNKIEIESIINGTIFNSSNRFEVKEDTQVMIGQPAITPVELINELRKLFSTIKEIKCAYNVHFHNPQMDEIPHTLVAIDMNGNWDEVISRASMIANSVHIPDPPVDFIHLNGRSGLDEYFKSNGKPFYKKKLLGIF